MKELPNWAILIAKYPNKKAETVFTEIGGKVQLNYDIGVFSNACATRISKALNDSGANHHIPYIKDVGPTGKMESQVSSGENKRWYIFRVKILAKYLIKTYGSPLEYQSHEYKSKLAGKKGIIMFEVTGWDDATGHADLWDGAKAVWQDYGGQANKILFWEAK